MSEQNQKEQQNHIENSEFHEEAKLKTPVRMEEVGEHQDGQRLDNFLMKFLKGVPKNAIYRIIRKGEVRVNKGRAKPESKLHTGDIVRIPPVVLPDQQSIQAPTYLQKILLDSIILEDKNLLVINKPSGVAVHRGSGSDTGVIECLRVARPDLEFLELVHRLDKETSGCLVLAKTGAALRALQSCTMDKRYLCLVQNRWRKSVFDQKAKLDTEHRENGERHVVVSDKGKDAHTRFTPMDDFLGASLMEARLFTGRTHQIRVHAAHMGHPLAGDERYGNEAFNKEMKSYGLKRMFLHAHSLMFDINGKDYAFSAPLPDDLNEVIERLTDNLEHKRTRKKNIYDN